MRLLSAFVVGVRGVPLVYSFTLAFLHARSLAHPLSLWYSCLHVLTQHNCRAGISKHTHADTSTCCPALASRHLLVSARVFKRPREREAEREREFFEPDLEIAKSHIGLGVVFSGVSTWRFPMFMVGVLIRLKVVTLYK